MTEIEILLKEGAVEYFAALHDLDPDEELTPSVLRSLCVQLGYPPELVGLEREEPYQG
jgi:hypothetical protein